MCHFHRLWIAVCLSVVAAGCDTSVPAENPYDPEVPEHQKEPATLGGSISLENGDATSATVEVRPSGKTARPEADGSFLIDDITPGTYTVVVTAPGHSDFTQGGVFCGVGQRVDMGRIAFENENRCVIARLSGAFCGPECDRMVADTLERVRSDPGDVVADLRRVEHLNSYALGTFLMLKMELEDLGRKLALAGAGGHVLRLIEIAGLVSLVGSYPSVKEAVRALEDRHEKAR